MKVLIPVDIAHPHLDLAEHVNWLLPLKGNDVKLLFVKEVLPSYERIMASMGDFPDDWTHQVDTKAKAMLSPIKERLTNLGATSSIEIVSGPPEHLIAAVAKDHHIDVTIMSPGQRSSIERFFLGSTSNAVVRLAPETILLLRDHGGHNKLDHVVFGVDGTEQSNYALKKAVSQFQLSSRQVKITLLHAVSVPSVVSIVSPAEVTVSLTKNLEMEGEALLAAALKILKDEGVNDAELRLVQGDPASELIRYAEQSNVQLIVTGAHGHSMVEHALVGSVASRIVSHAKCSAAIIKMPKK